VRFNPDDIGSIFFSNDGVSLPNCKVAIIMSFIRRECAGKKMGIQCLRP
jgi:hypothetical protein